MVMHRISTGKSGKLAEILEIVDNWSIRLWITRLSAADLAGQTQKMKEADGAFQPYIRFCLSTSDIRLTQTN